MPDASGQPASDVVAQAADTGSWMSRRGATVVLIAALALLVVTVTICLLIWLTPGMEPLDIPTVPRA